MKKIIIILGILLLFVFIGFSLDLYDLKTSIIVFVAILIGGYFGNKILIKSS